MKKYKVLFCDLDGTIIDASSGSTFPKGIWDMDLKLPVLDAIKRLSPEYVFIVTNQGGIEKNYVNEIHFIHKMHYVIDSTSEYCGIKNVDFRYCTSNNKENPCRKPNPDMLARIIEEHNVSYDKSEMLMIGDASGKPGQFSDSDKKTAENFGIDYLDVFDFIKESYV